MKRRELMRYCGGGIGGFIIGSIGGSIASLPSSGSSGSIGGKNTGAGGKQIPNRRLLTATAKFDPLRPQMAKMITEEMKKIGINYEPNLLRYEKNSDKVIRKEPDYDMWLVRISSTPARIEPNFHTSNFYTSESQHNQGWNWMGYESEEVDFLSDLQGQEMDKQERQKVVYRIQQKLHDDSPVLLVTHPQMLQFYRKDNVEFSGPFTPGEGINSFWAKVNAKPKARSEIREAWTSTLSRLNPIAVTDVLDLWFARLIYSRLLRVNPKGIPKPYETEELNIKSPTKIEIVLNEDLKWHDGSTVTAEDVKYTFELYKRTKAPYYNASLQKMKSVKAPTDNRVVFTLMEPTASFVHSALAGVMLLKKDKWKQIEKENDSLIKYNVENPLGSGPFKFEQWNRGGRLVLSRNENYVPSPPKIGKLIRTNRDSLELSLKATERNENDVVSYGVTPDLFERSSNKKNIGTQKALSIGYYGLFFNCDRLPFTDKIFRQAMQYIIPRKKIVKQVFGGKARPGVSIISPGNEFWSKPNLKSYPYDPKKAEQLLRDAGYTWDSGGNLHFPSNMAGIPSEEKVTIPVPDQQNKS